MGGRGRGRPKGSRKVSKAQGKSIAKCAVCSLTKRADKLKEHQVSSVLFDINGEPAGEELLRSWNISQLTAYMLTNWSMLEVVELGKARQRSEELSGAR